MSADEATVPSVMFDPTSPEFQADPYPFYRQLREQTPISRGPGDVLMLSRYRDCYAALHGQRWDIAADYSCTTRQGAEGDNPTFSGIRNLFGSDDAAEAPVDDPDRGARRRRLVGKAFTRKNARSLTPRLAEITHQLIDHALQAGEVELNRDFSFPLVNTFLSDLLEVPPADRTRLAELAEEVFRAFAPLFTLAPEEIEQLGHAGRELRDYVAALLAERRRDPGDDLLSALITAEEDGDKLSDEELVTTCCMLMLLVANTTVDSLSLSLLALLRNPDQLTLFREQPGIAATAVEELLRYDAPAQYVIRVATEDHNVDGYRIRGGDYALVVIGSANRDPAVFPDPDRLDLSRQPNPHLTFGAGFYHCIGAPVARVVAEFALRTLVTRAPKLALAGEPEISQEFHSRALTRLPATLR